MKKYLLDTSICVFLFRNNQDVVLAELRYGAYKSVVQRRILN